MKIAMVTETFFPQVNGVSTSIARFSRMLNKKGHEVQIFAPKPGKKEFESIKVHRKFSLTFPPYPEFKAPIFLGTDLSEFDIIHTHGPFSAGWAGLWESWVKKVPITTTFHTPLADYVHYITPSFMENFGRKVAWAYSRLHYNRYPLVMAPSKATINQLDEKGVKAPKQVLKTGIELKKYDEAPDIDVKEKYDVDEFILHTGRLSYEKDIPVVLKAFKKILRERPELDLVVTSKGPASDDLKQLAEELGIEDSVLFTGYVSEEELINWYRNAELGVIASEAETQGLVVLEQMACGTPVVGADFLAIPETIKEGENGFLFPLNDVNALKEKVLTALDSDLSEMKKKARETAEKNTSEIWCDRLLEKYEELI